MTKLSADYTMKSFLLLAVLLLGASVQAEDAWPEVTELIQGGETLTNLLLISETPTVANYSDKFEAFLQSAINLGRSFLKGLTEMMHILDYSPEVRRATEMIQNDIQAVQSVLDDLERNARLGNSLVKVTAKCVMPQYEAIAKIKDEAYKSLTDVAEDQRDAFKDLMAAVQLIQEQVRSLQEVEILVVQALISNDLKKIEKVIAENKDSVAKEVRIIQKTFKGALDDFNLVSRKSMYKLAENLQGTQVKSREVLEIISHCMKTNPESDSTA